jgi:cytochrome bd ubiquinol oxidase subunit II
MIFDYYTLKIIWWAFVGLLLIGFALTDGFDLGVGTLLPFIAKTDEQRRVLINAIGPTWEGNQVWFITAGGALFAAWPLVYAAAFSGFYWAMLLTLFALFLRPIGFDYRSKIDDPRWRNAWDWGLFVGGAVPALIFGVAFGNLLRGVPFYYDEFLRPFYSGTFFELLNPFALMAGMISLSMLIMHGAVFLQMRTEGELNLRAKKCVLAFGLTFIMAFALTGILQISGFEGYRIIAMPDPATVFTPLEKSVKMASGAWLDNFKFHPWMLTAPVMAFGGAILTILLSFKDRPGLGFIASCSALAGVILTAGFAMFPFIMPSSTHPDISLTVFDAVSSHRTLSLMFVVVLLFLPIVLIYSGWVYGVMRGKIKENDIRENMHGLY